MALMVRGTAVISAGIIVVVVGIVAVEVVDIVIVVSVL